MTSEAQRSERAETCQSAEECFRCIEWNRKVEADKLNEEECSAVHRLALCRMCVVLRIFRVEIYCFIEYINRLFCYI